MKKFVKTLITILLTSFLTFALTALTADDILKKLENNETHKTSYSTGRMEITDNFGTRVKTYRSYSGGSEKMLMEFTNIEDKGQKILRIDEEIYLYFPEAEEIIQITGNAMKDRVMGSDFSYEDMVGEKEKLSKYNTSIEKEETVDGALCYKIILVAKNPKKVVYAKQIVWIDKELFMFRKSQSLALSGKVIKELYAKDIKTVNGKQIPFYIEMKDAMKKNSKTVIKIITHEINIDIEEEIFSFEELSW